MRRAAFWLVVLLLSWRFFDWALVEAVWRPDPAACRAARGACWGFIADKYRFLLFGTYPFEEQWRAALASALLVILWAVSAAVRFSRAWLLPAWLAGLVLIGVLMWGGALGLPYVDHERWGGLALTLLLTTFGLAFAFPLSIALALGRRSGLPLVRALCIGYIELIRGVPLISLLFMASVMLPLFLPGGMSVDKLLRAQLALVLFAAAYLAEVVRGGLQAVPESQYEMADALGLTALQKNRFVVLPQALRIAVPPLVGTFIGFFKDTSLVTIIGLFDLLQALKVSLQEPAWVGYGAEGYLFVALVYFAFCFAMSRYAATLENNPAGPLFTPALRPRSSSSRGWR
ncbi:MAG TPA: amino acid ABC transporter permease [Burkholderiales bacterium]|nr:amino acid ABC transporter permease [Burkholderiales bacterium]